jgi:hypothetical protein
MCSRQFKGASAHPVSYLGLGIAASRWGMEDDPALSQHFFKSGFY